MVVHKNIRAKGRVQGVFYRASAAEKAKSLGLRGFVLNEPTGSVYMEVEGDSDAVDQLVTWARTGPPLAKVSGLDIEDGPLKGFSLFEIRR